MTRENILFAIIGILLGFIVGFMLASSMSQKTAMQQASTSSQTMPADHPPVRPQNSQNPQQVFEQVTASLEKARNEPKNFDAQVNAAALYYEIGRYDQAIEFLLKANQIKPNNVQVLAGLAAAMLQKGDAKAAEDAIAKLEKADPTNEDLPQFKEQLSTLKKQ